MNSENNKMAGDKDYGFPFVEVKPLQAKAKHTFEKEVIPALPKTEISKPLEIKSLTESSLLTGRKTRKNQSPLLLSLLFLIVIILGAMAYFLYLVPGQEEYVEPLLSTTENAQEEPPTALENDDNPEASTPITDSNETDDPSSNPTGTGELIIVNAKGPQAVWFIIAGSLPNERLAREEAQELLNKGVDVWLISPYGDTRNYRLSVGRYESFQSATEALEKTKVEFGESLWILKY